MDERFENYTGWVNKQIEIIEILKNIMQISNATSRVDELIEEMENSQRLKDMERTILYLEDSCALKSDLANYTAYQPYYSQPAPNVDYQQYAIYGVIIFIIVIALWKSGKLRGLTGKAEASPVAYSPKTTINALDLKGAIEREFERVETPDKDEETRHAKKAIEEKEKIKEQIKRFNAEKGGP